MIEEYFQMEIEKKKKNKIKSDKCIGNHSNKTDFQNWKNKSSNQFYQLGNKSYYLTNDQVTEFKFQSLCFKIQNRKLRPRCFQGNKET